MNVLDKFHSDLIGKQVITPYGEATLIEIDLINKCAKCEHIIHSLKKLTNTEIENESIKYYGLEQITLKS